MFPTLKIETRPEKTTRGLERLGPGHLYSGHGHLPPQQARVVREFAMNRMMSRAIPPLIAVLLPLVAVATSGCRQQDKAPETIAATPLASAPAEAASKPPSPRRDLSIDEALGGHTLARHVGKSDAELRDRLRREKQISAASTYTDRVTAEQAVGAALASGGDELEAWQARSGRRPNLVLHFAHHGETPLGRSLSRGQRMPITANRALVVLRWDERASRFYVLTSYPEAEP